MLRYVHLGGAGALCAALVSSLAFAGQIDPPSGAVQETGVTPIYPQSVTPPLVIDAPGSYVLQGDWTLSVGIDGIVVSASDVTIDLNGFTLSGGGVGLNGVLVSSSLHQNIVVRNGTIRDFTQYGIRAVSVTGAAEGLRIVGNGDLGASFGMNSRMTDCQVIANGDDGALLAEGSIVESSVFADNIGTGLSVFRASTVIGCTFQNNGGLGGINAQPRTTIQDCTARENTGRGFILGFGCSISNSVAADNTGDGFDMSASTASGCMAYGNEGDGFDANTSSSIINCTATQNELYGIFGAGLVQQSIVNSNTLGGVILVSGAVLQDSLIGFNGGNGVALRGIECRVVGNQIYNNGPVGASGILLEWSNGAGAGGRHRIDGNTISQVSYGIRSDISSGPITHNYVVRNQIRNVDIATIDMPGNVTPIVFSTDPTTAGPWDNFE